jgi:hypothetical protein
MLNMLSPLSASRNRLAMLFMLVALVLGWTLESAATPDPQTPPDPVEVIHRSGDRISVFSGDTHIPPGVIQDGQIVSIGGDVVIEGEVEEVVAVFGSVKVTGRVQESMVTVLSNVELDGATIGRDLINVLGDYENVSSLVHGEDFHLSLGKWLPDLWTTVAWFRFVKMLMIFVLLVVLSALAPNRIRTLGKVASRRYVAAFFMGLLGYLIFLIVFGLLALTVIGLPIALLAFWIIKWLGIAGILFSVGHRLGASFGREISVLGSIMIAFVLIFLLPTAIAFIAGPLWLIISAFMLMVLFLCLSLPGVGLIFLTRFGTRE